MTETWMSRAAERCVALSLDLDKILAAHQIVSCAVGSNWFVEQERLLSQGGRTVADAHPLHSALNATTDTAIAQVCELAHYLIEFKNDPVLPSVLDDLRSAKYHAIVQELAFAYRWRDAGAMVSLRPPTRDGEADFLGTIANLPFTVETSLFPTDIFKHPRFRLPTIVAESLDSVRKSVPSVTVKIRILRYPPGNVEAQVRAWVKDAAQAFTRSLHDNSSGTGRVENEFCLITVEQTTDASEVNPFRIDELRGWVNAREHDWDVFVRDVVHAKPDGEPLYRVAHSGEGDERARIFAKFPIEEINPSDQIGRKLKKEARQLSGVAGPRVVILDASRFGDVFQLQSDALRRELLRIMRNIPELACVFIAMREWTTAFRFKYRWVFARNPHSVYQLPEFFLRRLTEREWKWDFLAQREFPDLSREDAARYYADRMDYPKH